MLAENLCWLRTCAAQWFLHWVFPVPTVTFRHNLEQSREDLIKRDSAHAHPPRAERLWQSSTPECWESDRFFRFKSLDPVCWAPSRLQLLVNRMVPTEPEEPRLRPDSQLSLQIGGQNVAMTGTEASSADFGEFRANGSASARRSCRPSPAERLTAGPTTAGPTTGGTKPQRYQPADVGSSPRTILQDGHNPQIVASGLQKSWILARLGYFLIP